MKPPTRTRTAGRIALATVLSAGLLLSACGDDDEATSSDDTAAETTEEQAADDTTESTEASPLDDAADGGVKDGVLTVELVDYAFEGLPESVPAGTKLQVENTSAGEFHELVAFKLPEGETRTAEELVQLPEEELMALFGEGPPAAVLLAGPNGGEQTAAVGDGTLTEPGSYVLFCSIPVGADPEELEAQLSAPEGGEPPAEDPNAGPPHFTEGMYADLVVE